MPCREARRLEVHDMKMMPSMHSLQIETSRQAARGSAPTEHNLVKFLRR